MPWKCQGKEEKSEGEKGTGSGAKREKKRNGERMRGIALLTIRRIFKDIHLSNNLIINVPEAFVSGTFCNLILLSCLIKKRGGW